jgi:tRNA (Thr-GGU) A37 N-methylase
VEDVDIIDGTPLLDIMPYVPDFDMRETDQIGWLAGRSRNVRYTKSDGRLK